MQTNVSALTPRTLMPAPSTVTADGKRRTITVGLPATIEFSDTTEAGDVTGELRLSGRHRYELVRFELRADSIGPDELRSIPVRELMVKAARRHAEGVIVTGSRMAVLPFNPQELSTDELVAGLWQLAQACRDNPNRLIAQELDISAGAAAQRVSRLRRAGLIPPAEKRGGRY